MPDMSLDELKQYKGSSPRPEDFDKYWADALDELDKVKPKAELIPAKFKTEHAQCFDLYFTGVGGSRIHAKYLRPVNTANPHPAILQFHGYTGNSGDWCDKLNYVLEGYSVAALDCRGQGGYSQDKGSVVGNTYWGHIIRGIDDKKENLLFRQIFLDTAQLARIIMNMPEVDETRIGAMGGSQAGGLTLVCAALVPEIKRIAPYYPFLCDYKRVYEYGLDNTAYSEIKAYLRSFDPRHEHIDEMFYKLSYIDVQNFVDRIKAKVLMGTGLTDTSCPPSSQFAAYNKIKSEKNIVLYPDYGHEWLPDFLDMAFEFFMDL